MPSLPISEAPLSRIWLDPRCIFYLPYCSCHILYLINKVNESIIRIWVNSIAHVFRTCHFFMHACRKWVCVSLFHSQVAILFERSPFFVFPNNVTRYTTIIAPLITLNMQHHLATSHMSYDSVRYIYQTHLQSINYWHQGPIYWSLLIYYMYILARELYQYRVIHAPIL